MDTGYSPARFLVVGESGTLALFDVGSVGLVSGSGEVSLVFLAGRNAGVLASLGQGFTHVGFSGVTYSPTASATLTGRTAVAGITAYRLAEASLDYGLCFDGAVRLMHPVLGNVATVQLADCRAVLHLSADTE